MAPRSGPASHEGSPLTAACQALALLTLEGLSTGLFVALLALGRDVVPYVARNDLTPGSRALLLVVMGSGAVSFAGAGLGYLWRRSGEGPQGLRRTALLLSPLLLLGLVPPLLWRWLWTDRQLALLATVAILGLGGQALLRTSLSQPRSRRDGPIRRAGGHLRQRLPPVPSWWPPALVVMSAGAYAVFFAYHTMANHWNVRSRSFDLALENNLLWNLVHGGPFFKSSPIFGPTGSHFSHHATFFAYLIAPFYALAQRPETLLVIQATLMGAAAIPLFLFAKRHVGAAAGCLIALAYLLYPPLHGANLYDFHYLSLGPFFLWTSLYLLESRRDWLATVAVVVTLSVREDVAAGLVIIGLYLVLSGERPRAGLVVAVVSAAYFLTMKFFIMPLAGRPATFLYIYKDLVPPGERTFAGVLKTVLGNPAYTLWTLLERDKLVYLLQILAPLAFLPLRRPLGLLFLVPGFLFTLLSTGYAPVIQISFQYTSHWTPFVFVAAVLSVAWLSRPEPSAEVAAVRRLACLWGLVIATLVCTFHYGAVLREGTARGGFERFRFGTTAADQARHRALYELIALVPSSAKVAGSERLVPHVSSRPDAYTLRIGVFDADYLLFPIERQEVMWPQEGAPLVRLLESGEFGVLSTRSPYALAQRGHPTSSNRAVLVRLKGE